MSAIIAEEASRNLLLEKLNWREITSRLANYCYSEPAEQLAVHLQPTYQQVEDIRAVWEHTLQLKTLLLQGYSFPSLQLADLSKVFKALSYGQVLETKQLLMILQLLQASKRWYLFCKQFASECGVLRKYRASLLPMPRLVKAIERVVNERSSIKNDASQELRQVRQQKHRLKQQIEDILTQLFHQRRFEPYLKEDYFTMRNEKYVIPLRVDGNGRVRGNAIDFSRSKVTMFFEPIEIEKQNRLLQTIEFSERLACYKVLQEITASIAQEFETLKQIYDAIVDLDLLQARARLAKELNANAIDLTAHPALNLKGAYHPLLLKEQCVPVKNSLTLAGKNTLIISGANAGGKTVMLKCVGLLQLMAKAGLLLTCDADSQMCIFSQVHFVGDDEQSISNSLSTFSSHLLHLQAVLAESSEEDLVLIDEIAAGTDPDAGAALAQAILEHLATRKITTVVSTHFPQLKQLAYSNPAFGNASMQFSLHNLQPTYRLLLSAHGHSFTLEISRLLGISPIIIKRAEELRADEVVQFEQTLAHLQQEREQLLAEKNKLHLEIMRYQQYRERWEKEMQEITSMRQQLACQTKDLPPKLHIESKQTKQEKATAVGKPLSFEEIEIGQRVFCVPLRTSAIITKLGRSELERIEVDVKGLRTKVNLADLRIL